MVFPTNEIELGSPAYGLRGKAGEAYGVIFHTTEGAGPSRDAALATIRFQSSPTNTSGGSYNFIIYDGGVFLTVPYLEASGGVNPGSAAWAPQRYPWLKSALPAMAYANPNEYHLNISFSGKTKEFAAGRIPANMIDTAARLVMWAEKQPWGADNLVISGHMHWQTNRSDPSQYVLDRIMERIKELEDNRVFVDIDDSFAKAEILRATEAGIFMVPKDRKFNPKGTVTREQLAAVADRILRKAGVY